MTGIGERAHRTDNFGPYVKVSTHFTISVPGLYETDPIIHVIAADASLFERTLAHAVFGKGWDSRE